MNSPDEEELSLARGDKADSSARPARKLGEMEKTITMAQIAKAAGVSQGAISSLLNDRDYGIRVSEKTRERVFKVCREMGYIPNDLRAVVRMYPELGEFCLLVSSGIRGGLSDPFVARVAQAAMSAIKDPSHPLTLAFYDPAADYSGNPDHLPYPVRSGVASKFLLLGPPNSSLLQQILRRGVSVIHLGIEAPLPGVLSLVPDYAEASQLAVRHLFEKGHRHIAIVSGPFGTADAHIMELHRGVKLAYDAFGIPIEAQNIVYGDLSYQAGMAAFDELMTHPLKPTAIFCLSDEAAAGALAQAGARGAKVPDEMSIVGCSDDFCSHLLLPGLTTIHVPAEEMAELAIGEVDSLVRSGLVIEAEKRVIPVRLVERASVAAVPAA